jgi:hypothetical protein
LIGGTRGNFIYAKSLIALLVTVRLNYRPISLLNVDYKIASRAISRRLLGIIGSIVGSDQTCGIPGRTISENLTLICDLIEYADRADLPLALLSLDQEKAKTGLIGPSFS